MVDTALAADPIPGFISGCGIAFRVGEQMPEGQLLDQITLLPSETQLRLMAMISVDTIPGSDETDVKPYMLRGVAGKESDAKEMLISILCNAARMLPPLKRTLRRPKQRWSWLLEPESTPKSRKIAVHAKSRKTSRRRLILFSC